MTQQFVVPTIFNAFLGVWYYVLMSEMNELQSVPLHVFCILGRVFYGMVVSFPFDAVVRVSLGRLILWVSILILTLDIFQVVSIVQSFNSYNLTDSLSILFSAVFILCDLLFVLQLYRHATEIKIVMGEKPKVNVSAEDNQTEVPEVIVKEDLDQVLRFRKPNLKF